MKDIAIKGFNFLPKDLEYYLQKHPLKELNNRIYSRIVKSGGCNFDVTDVFNGAYFICTQIYLDDYPENNFRAKFNFPNDNDIQFGEEEGVLAWEWWIAYYVIRYCDECFPHQKYKSFIRYFDNSFFNDRNRFIQIDDFRVIDFLADGSKPEDHNWINYDFPLDKPQVPELITNWEEITNQFEQDYIEYIVFNYSCGDDMKNAKEAIFDAWKYYEMHKNDLPF